MSRISPKPTCSETKPGGMSLASLCCRTGRAAGSAARPSAGSGQLLLPLLQPLLELWWCARTLECAFHPLLLFFLREPMFCHINLHLYRELFAFRCFAPIKWRQCVHKPADLRRLLCVNTGYARFRGGSSSERS